MTVREILTQMITTHAGSISSKIVIGALAYMIVTIALILVMFINPGFPGLTEIVMTHILTSGSLLGLTTVENLRTPLKAKKEDENDCEEVENT